MCAVLRRVAPICAAGLMWCFAAARAGSSANPAQTGLDWLAAHESRLATLADTLWNTPEIYHQEAKTAAFVTDELARAGFTIERGVADLPTAFVASYGSGRPIIGIVALLDALPGLSQKKLVTDRAPIEPGGPGHACGHNLIAAGDVGAAVAIKEAMATHGLSGTIKLFGAPAEEIYHGGVYMVRAGAFNGLDALLFWHPSSVTTAIARSGLAMRSVKFVFTGVPSDATDAAESGRNTLTAIEMLNEDVREMRRSFSAHTVVNHVVMRGGQIPSVVPELAEAWYFVHARDIEDVDGVVGKITAAAQQAAGATGTSVDVQSLSGSHHWLINTSLAKLIHQNLVGTEAPEFSEDELRVADAMRRSFGAGGSEAMFRGVLPSLANEEPVHISDDTAEAGWVVPRGGFLVACFPAGIASHTWQWTALGTSTIAHKGMMRAARAMVSSAVTLLTDPISLRAVRDEFERQTAAKPYRSPLPPGQGPFKFLPKP